MWANYNETNTKDKGQQEAGVGQFRNRKKLKPYDRGDPGHLLARKEKDMTGNLLYESYAVMSIFISSILGIHV